MTVIKLQQDGTLGIDGIHASTPQFRINGLTSRWGITVMEGNGQLKKTLF
ncbi:hypothetical protein OAM01_00500 [bacterium]|nr:hypothetical protein [bacterium]